VHIENGEIYIRPTVGVYATYQRLSYKPWFAIAEFVDNSTQSYFKNREELIEQYKKEGGKKLQIYINYNSVERTLEILDNAFGMEIEDFTRALVLDSPPSDRSGRSEFGMGLKTAACWFGKKWTIETTRLGSLRCLTATVDVDELAKTHQDNLHYKILKANADEHYTIIRIEDIQQPIRGRASTRIKEQLSSIYRADIRSGEIEIYWNGEPLEFEDPPFLEEQKEDGTVVVWKKEVSFVVLWERKGFELPVKGWVGIRNPGKARDAGFVLFRRGRVIIGGPERCIALLVPTDRVASPGLKSNMVSLKLCVKCTITIEGTTIKSKYFDILQCESSDLVHIDTFVLLCQAFVSTLFEQSNTRDAIWQLFNSLLALFTLQPASDLSKERQGLWGELFVMRALGATKHLVQYWHKEVSRKFDFSYGSKRIEVKTTTGSNRIHAFSHQQLHSNSGNDIVIASMMLRPEEAGLSLRELIDDARSKLADDYENLKKLERAVKYAGMDALEEIGPAYDEGEALANLSWFRAVDVPKFPLPEPAGVSGTRYNVDLSTAPRMSVSELERFIADFLNK